MTTTAEVLGDLATKSARLQAQLQEATQLLRDVVDGEEGDYPIAAIRAFRKGGGQWLT